MITEEQLQQAIQQNPARWEEIQRTLDAVHATIPDANRETWEAMMHVRPDAALMLTLLAQEHGLESDTYKIARLAVTGAIEGVQELRTAIKHAKRREYQREYYAANREHIRAQRREHAKQKADREQGNG